MSDLGEKNVFTSEQMYAPEYRMRDIKRDDIHRKRILVNMFLQDKPLSSRIADIDAKHLVKYYEQKGYMDADIKCLYDLFKSKFNLRDEDIRIHYNRTVDQVHEILENVGNTNSNEYYDVFIFAFCTYLHTNDSSGGKRVMSEELLEFADGQISLTSLLGDIKDKKAVRMRPKIFLIQADDLRMKHPMISTRTDNGGILAQPSDAPGETTEPTDEPRFSVMIPDPRSVLDSRAEPLPPRVLVRRGGCLPEIPTSAPTKGEPYELVSVKIPTDADLLVMMSTVPQFFGVLMKIKAQSNQPSHSGGAPHNERTDRGGILAQPSDAPGEPTEPTDEPRCSVMIQAFKDIMEDKRYEQEDLFCKTPMMNARFKELIHDLQLEQNKDYANPDLPLPLVKCTFTKFLML